MRPSWFPNFAEMNAVSVRSERSIARAVEWCATIAPASDRNGK